MVKAWSYFGKTSLHAPVSEHWQYLVEFFLLSNNFMIRAVNYSELQRNIPQHVLMFYDSVFVWCSSMYQLRWRMRNPASWLNRLHCLLLLFTTNKAAPVFLIKRGRLLCCRSCIAWHVLLYCDIFKNSINLGSVSATLICVWRYLFWFESPWIPRTSATRQNYTLHSLLKWEWAQAMKDI